MGGRIIAVLGLLSLVSGALLAGEDQEETTSQSNNLESSVATTSLSFVNSADFHDVSVGSNLSEFVEATSGSQGTETTLKTERPVSEVLSTATELESATVTGAPEEVTTESDRAASSPRRTFPTPDTSDVVTSADLTPPTPTSRPAATAVVEEGTTETSDNETERPSLVSTLRTSAAQTKTSMESPVDPTEPATTSHRTWMSTITTSLFITTTVTSADPTSPATQSTTTSRTTRAEVQKGSSVLEVGDDKELPSYHSITRSNPLFVMIVSIFTVMVVMIVVVVGFHRYKKRSSRTEFRRLQDLPMDDMMEDTPLSLYSY
ncbi:uncharacterized protein LOC142098834 [Mixophyes fleayi]|uniref:uncharacterized protein LOC142098834 n=1 Tax=Mixophyes fleayi TaxID=3061075 RepID=UPI003F4DA6B3